MLSKDQINKIKKQLVDQINSNFPKEKRAESLKQIDTMEDKKFEEFLIQNNLISGEGGEQQCIFCSILEGKIPTNKFAESEHAIATLDINPISKAHAIIIPKIHSKEAPKQAYELAEVVKQQIQKVFKPKKIEISSATVFDHEIINILPVYKDETMESEKKKATQKELQEIQNKLIAFEKEKKPIKKPKPKKQEVISDKTHWLPIRIP